MIRVGLGYDIHRLIQGRPLILGGIVLPFEKGEDGHSDGDVLFHAITDALLGAYRNADLRWSVARSWEQVEEHDFDSWVLLLNRVEPEGIEPESDIVYFDAGNNGNGMAQQLAGGRVAVAWGYLSWADLAKKFKTASDRIYEARY